MTEKSTKYLSDILMAIELIEEFIVDDKDFTLYDQDRKTQSAVERQLAIIGEALNQLKKLKPEIEIENDKQIISFRNRLVHAYDSLDNSMIWAIISKHLSPLKIEIQKLM
ncbi:MAG: DUF86 domain-containing protein [Flavobacterium psychrophilum]